jgi:hypothetical protein
MGRKFIPNGDFDFVMMAENFARQMAAEPSRFSVSQDDCDQLGEAVRRFRAALNASRVGERSAVATRAKEDARADAERIIRRLGHVVRSNLNLDAATKMTLGIRPRAEKARQLPCPQEPPELRFVRALHEASGATPVHELAFCALHGTSNAKPPGAVRLELFVDLIPPEELIPAHPGANHGSRPWYLRSFTRSPIKLTPPMARVPMRVVYWGRWADSLGNVGPFSATAVAWIEGGSNAFLPGGTGMTLGSLSGRKPVPILEDLQPIGPANREAKYSVAVLEVQYESLNLRDADPMLPAPDERPMRQLEAPPTSEAA